MNALLFGTYNARHAANALLASDLRAAGVGVTECHEPLWEETRDKHAPYFAPLGLARLALRYAGAAWRLARRFPAASRDAALVAVGFNGQLDVVLARLLDRRRPILFAPLVTVSETLIDDRESYGASSPAGRLLRALDRLTLSVADLVVIDTAAHRDYLCERFGVPAHKVVVQYLGAERPFADAGARRVDANASAVDATSGQGDVAAPTSTRPLRVLGYSSYLPLHGSEVIALAARLVPHDAGIAFELIGTGPGRARSDAFVKKLPHVRTVDWIAYDELPPRIAGADVVLGVFGTSVKARIVVPNKVYQAAAVGSAIVTADTPAIREVFVHGKSIWAIEPTPRALADALLVLAGDPALRARLARGAREAVLRVASDDARASRLRAALASPAITTRTAALATGAGA